MDNMVFLCSQTQISIYHKIFENVGTKMSDSQQANKEAEPIKQDESIVSNNAAIDSEDSSTTSQNDAKLELFEPEYDDDPNVVREAIADPYNNMDYTNENLENLKTVGAILRYHRQKSGMTIQEVASKIKARTGTVADIENDRLNNSSCVSFSKAFIMNYAALMKLNPDEMFDLYLQNISETVSIAHEKSHNKVDKQMARNWVLVVSMILVATAGYFVFSASEGNKSKDNEGTLVNPQTTVVANHDSAEPLVTGQMQIGNTDNPVVIEAPENSQAPEVKVVSPNTARATAQAQALAASSKDNEAVADNKVEQPRSLALPANSIKPSSSLLADRVETKASMMVASEQGKVENNKNISIATSSQEQISEHQAVQHSEHKASDSSTNLSLAKEAVAEQFKSDEAKAKQEPKEVAEEKIELKDKLKDISSKVKLTNREGLASLNSAEIEVVKKVALKIVDSQKKVLASGVYDAPKSIKVIGIPPIVVELSDTQAVKIHYQGGNVKMPKDKQVKLELPMRQ